MRLRNVKGMSLVEVVLTLAVMTLLTVAALPRIVDIVSTAKKAKRNYVVGAIRSGIDMYQIGTADDTNPFGNLPAQLDTAPWGDCGPGAAACFTNILESGQEITDSKWRKISNTTYDHDPSLFNVSHYRYDSVNATFNCFAGVC